MYRYFNANYKNNFVNDCVVRAISIAENKTWEQTFNELSKIASKQGILIDDVEFVERYLDSKYPRRCFKGNVEEFVRNHPTGIFLITMKGHITCLIDGFIYDTFDCTKYSIKCAWKVSK